MDVLKKMMMTMIYRIHLSASLHTADMLRHAPIDFLTHYGADSLVHARAESSHDHTGDGFEWTYVLIPAVILWLQSSKPRISQSFHIDWHTCKCCVTYLLT